MWKIDETQFSTYLGDTGNFKGTVIVILSDPPCKDCICPIYNGTLKSFV